MRIALAIGALAAAMATAAIAKPEQLGEIAGGYTYYNKPGATLSQHNADLKACAVSSGFQSYAQARDMTFKPAPGTGGILAPIINSAIWAGPLAGLSAARVENCMVVRGWRVMRLSTADGEALVRLSNADLPAQLSSLVGAAPAPGELVRVFANQAAHPASVTIAARPMKPGPGQLSLRMLETGLLDEPPAPSASPSQAVQGAAVQSAPAAKPSAPAPPVAWPSKPIRLADIGKAPPGAALLLVHVEDGGFPIVFGRQPPQSGDAGLDGPWQAKAGNGWTLLAIPPGRWRFMAAGYLSFCMGAPDFEAKAGQVVYAGSFTVKGETLRPNMDLVPAQAFLSKTPLAERVQPVAYRNGARGPCGEGLPYALEFDDAPFDPNYQWGSRAK